MGRPSIFSKDYEKRMKRRKIRNIILIIILILGIGGFFARGYISKNINFSSFKSFFSKDKGQVVKEDINKDENPEDKKEEVIKEEIKEEEIKDKELLVSLGSGKEIKVIYEENQGARIYKSIDPMKNKVSFDIASNKDFMLLIDEETQNMYTINKDGTLEDISLKTYVTSDNSSTFHKDTILKDNPDYTWHSSPRFVDNNTIAYISKLPWFNREERYVWLIDLNSKNHRILYNIIGNSISFGKLEEKGLEVNQDGSTKYLKTDGTVVD